MYRYTGFSLTFDSELELPELAEGHAAPEVIIRRGQVDPADMFSAPDDEVISRSVAQFRIRGGREIVVDAIPDADPGALRASLLGKVMAYLLRQRGWLPLHASAVEILGSVRGGVEKQSSAVLFLGHSGAGKSTTAAAFHARGYPVIADDLGAVKSLDGSVLLHGTWSGLRLLADALAVIGTSSSPACFLDYKHVFRLERRGSDAPIPIKRIYFLEYRDNQKGPRIHAEAIRGFPAVALLNSNSYLESSRSSDELLQLNLERAASIAPATRIYRLFRPRSLDCLPELVDFVERDITGDTPA
jgi:hypothetical protein